MKRIQYILVIAFLGAVTLSGCKKIDKPNFHTEYFGLAPGAYVIYDVVEITHDKDVEQHDTLYYQLKTVWGDEYIDNEGRSTYEFKRYQRSTENDSWELIDLWHGIIDGPRAELVEENQRKVKLYLAPTLLKYWNANAFNSMAEENYYYRSIHQDTTINGVLLDSTLTVEADVYPSMIDSVRYYEVYAKNIGLVYKHVKDNHFQFKENYQVGENPVDPEVDKGSELYMTYVSSGIQ